MKSTYIIYISSVWKLSISVDHVLDLNFHLSPQDRCQVNVYWMGENVTDPTPCLLLQTIHLKQTQRLTPRAFHKVIYPLLTLYPGQSARHHRDYRHIGTITDFKRVQQR